MKAYYVKNIDAKRRISTICCELPRKANLKLSEEQKDFLDTLTSSNIKARYDDYKLKFLRGSVRENSLRNISQDKGIQDMDKTRALKLGP